MNYFPHSAGDFDQKTLVRRLPMVYVIATPNFEFIKVGMTKNSQSRLRNIQSGCPLQLRLWCSIRTPKPSLVEKALHGVLVHCGSRGEWFSPANSDLDAVLDFCALTNAHIKEVHGALLQA